MMPSWVKMIEPSGVAVDALDLAAGRPAAFALLSLDPGDAGSPANPQP
jgi:hypothetical protein